MFAELARVMNYATGNGTFHDSLSENVVGKRTKSNLNKTNVLLQKLYTFDPQYAPFRAFAYFWPLASETDRKVMTLLLALTAGTILGGIVGTLLSVPIAAVAWAIIKSWNEPLTATDLARVRERQSAVAAKRGSRALDAR